jgi:hypothetical protein
MEFSSEQKDIAKRLSYGASLFRSYFYKDDSFKKQFKDNFQALVCFSENYAYQRQGAAPAYPEIAMKALQNRFGQGIKSVTITDAKEVWKDYQEIAGNQYHVKVNKKLNPMCSDNGLLTIMANKNIMNLASYVNRLIQNNQTKEAHELIDDIRGIGPKIASLYLRDIAYLGKIPEKGIKDQYYLQPVDTWIEQALSIIFGEKKPEVLMEKQEMIVNLCKMADVSPIAFSQGAWMLGSQIAGDYSKFQQLAKGQNAKAIIKEHIEERKRYVSDAEHWLTQFPE